MIEPTVSILVMLVTVTAFIYYLLTTKSEAKDQSYASYFLVILAIGVILHYPSYAPVAADQSPSELFVEQLLAFGKAMETALRAFSGMFNIGAAQQEYADLAYKLAVFLHYLASMLLTFLVAIKLFGKNVANRIRIWANANRSKYIVIGSGERAQLFLKSLDNKQKRRTTVILETADAELHRDLLFQGFSVLTMHYILDKSKPLQTPVNDLQSAREALRRAGLYHNNHPTKVIALSEYEEVNLLVAKIVTKHIAAAVQPTRSPRGRMNPLSEEQEAKLAALQLSAHIMYKTLNRTEHFTFAEYALGRVRFFNLYEARAQKFIAENPITKLIPSSWIDTSKARLRKPYSIGSIFVGCGLTNQHLLRNTIANYQLLGTPYSVLIAGLDADNIEAQFRNAAPGLFTETSDCRLAFAKLNVLHAEFYQQICAEIEGLDYASVFIALGSDKLSIETALELRQRLYAAGLLQAADGDYQYSRARIFVKVKQTSLMTDHEFLNEGWSGCEITVFGSADEVLSERHILQEDLDFLAKRIANSYWESAAKRGQESNTYSTWDSLSEFKRHTNRLAALSIRPKLNLLGFDLVDDGQVTGPEVLDAFQRAYDMETALRLRSERKVGMDQEPKRFVDLVERDQHGAIIDNARNNLARLEHQRWNAIHLANGWTQLPLSEVREAFRQDEKAKRHACIATYEGLTAVRRKQAEEAVQSGSKQTLDEGLIDADILCYDFDVMDRLPGLLENSRYRITKLER